MTLSQLRKAIADREGFPQSFDGSLSALESLPAEQRAQLTNSTLRYVAAKPEGFDDRTVIEATEITNRGGVEPSELYVFRS